MQCRWALRRSIPGFLFAAMSLLTCKAVHADSVPDWLSAQAAVKLPAQDPKTEAIVLYDERVVTVAPNGKTHNLQRRAIRILRPDGQKWGTVRVDFDAQTRITNLRAWSIPADGKPYEVKEKQALETAIYGVENGELVSDLRTRVLVIPAATPGSLVGYEWEQDEQPYLPLAAWDVQDVIPVLAARFVLKMPAGWSFRDTWLNHSTVPPVGTASNQWQWTLENLPALRIERSMPPWRKIATRMSLELSGPGNANGPAMNWTKLAEWYANLAQGLQEVTPDMRRRVQELTRDKATTVEKITALARYVQTDIRYVAVELGIGGMRPHKAADVFVNRYGDCKDKATLLSSMLHEIGVDSYYVLINTERGAISKETPPSLSFNHVILAIVLPEESSDPALLSVVRHPSLGRLLFFDPTQTLTPLGRLDGMLQGNYGLLIAPRGGDLLELPLLPSESSYVRRTAQLKLNAQGDLGGDLQDIRMGDAAWRTRGELRQATSDADRIQPVEHQLADSLTTFNLQRAAIGHLNDIDQPFEWHYSFQAPGYAKLAGDLMMVRPWVTGSFSSSLLETREPRQHPIEFDGPSSDSETFEIELPEGYVVDELPSPVNEDMGYLKYQSRTEAVGRKIRYTRTLEIKQVAIPVEKSELLKQFYRSIYADERRVAVLKRAAL